LETGPNFDLTSAEIHFRNVRAGTGFSSPAFSYLGKIYAGDYGVHYQNLPLSLFYFRLAYETDPKDDRNVMNFVESLEAVMKSSKSFAQKESCNSEIDLIRSRHRQIYPRVAKTMRASRKNPSA
jgi:hypothetical protein